MLQQERQNKTRFLTDSCTGEDKFEIHTSISDTILEIINDIDIEQTPFNLGLFGSWGTGKSTRGSGWNGKRKRNRRR